MFHIKQISRLLLLAVVLLTVPVAAQSPYYDPSQPAGPYEPDQGQPAAPQPFQQHPGQYAPPQPPSQQIPPQAPQQVPPQARPQPGPQQQHPMQYAYRPDLSNQQYGECLGLERNWKNLYQQYAQGYQQAQYLNQTDPRYAQMTYYLADLRRRLDAAWNEFSSKCIYFRSH